jgi:hypothetical protein
MNSLNNVSPIKAVRFIVSLNEEEGNVISYNTKLDGSNNMPSAYNQALLTAKNYKGTISGEMSDGKYFLVKSFV